MIGSNFFNEMMDFFKLVRKYIDDMDRLIEESHMFRKDEWEKVFPHELGDDFVILHRKEERC